MNPKRSFEEVVAIIALQAFCPRECLDPFRDSSNKITPSNPVVPSLTGGWVNFAEMVVCTIHSPLKWASTLTYSHFMSTASARIDGGVRCVGDCKGRWIEVKRRIVLRLASVAANCACEYGSGGDVLGGCSWCFVIETRRGIRLMKDRSFFLLLPPHKGHLANYYQPLHKNALSKDRGNTSLPHFSWKWWPHLNSTASSEDKSRKQEVHNSLSLKKDKLEMDWVSGDAEEVLLFRPRTHFGRGNKEGCLGKDGRIPVEVDDTEVEREGMWWPSCLGGRKEEIPSESLVAVDIGKTLSVLRERMLKESQDLEIWKFDVDLQQREDQQPSDENYQHLQAK